MFFDRKVHIDEHGFVYLNDVPVAMLTQRDRTCCEVFIRNQSQWRPVARFSNFRPLISARAWIKFLLERKDPIEIIEALRKQYPLDYAKKLGFVSIAEVKAEHSEGMIARRSFTGRKRK